MQSAPDPPHPDAALVLRRWNSWVQLWWPATDETSWIDLDAVDGFEVLDTPRGTRTQRVASKRAPGP